jgi:pimeloyl-ACP methyl ester carboxylesterase
MRGYAPTSIPSDQRFGVRLGRLLMRKLAVPSMLFAGSSGPAPMDNFERSRGFYTGPFELVLVDRAGHFIHREAPAKVLEKTLPLLEKYGRP